MAMLIKENTDYMIKKKISLHDIVNVGLQELQESLKLFERQTLLMFIENVGSVFPHYYFKRLLFHIVYSSLLFHSLIDHISLGAFMGSPFCSITCFVLVPYCFDYSSFVVSS